jgi:hypothetical protein
VAGKGKEGPVLTTQIQDCTIGAVGENEMLRRIAIAAAFLLAAVAGANAMNFSLRDQNTIFASGPIEEGDAAKFAALARFGTLELDSPGGFVGEALAMAANMDARGGIRTVLRFRVRDGAVCIGQDTYRVHGRPSRHSLLP